MASIVSDHARRPWLTLYTPQHGLLAHKISSRPVAADAAEDDSPLPLEVWLLIAAQIPLDAYASLCTLASTCHWLRFVSRHPPFWEAYCRAAFRVERGFLDNDRMLRSYGWSWRSMFMQRKRLRYDGVYYLATKRLIHGLNEGRGMKETDSAPARLDPSPVRVSPRRVSAPLAHAGVGRSRRASAEDFYNPAGNWVTQYRILRFFACGAMFSYLCSSQTPADVRKAAAAVTPGKRATRSP